MAVGTERRAFRINVVAEHHAEPAGGRPFAIAAHRVRDGVLAAGGDVGAGVAALVRGRGAEFGRRALVLEPLEALVLDEELMRRQSLALVGLEILVAVATVAESEKLRDRLPRGRLRGAGGCDDRGEAHDQPAHQYCSASRRSTSARLRRMTPSASSFRLVSAAAQRVDSAGSAPRRREA
jgi:hypothetical protein